MTRTILCLLAAPLAAFLLHAAPPRPAAESEAIERAVLDYVEGVYECKPELIQRSVHPDLHKFGFYRKSADQEYQSKPMTRAQLEELCKTYNKDGHIPKDAPKAVEVLDALDQTASVKLTASWGIDYMHLAKYDGRWQIVQVLWQTRPEDPQ